MANEKRLISYDVLIAHLDSCIEQGKGLFKSVCVAIKCFVEQMPTVDAVEVVHGRWERAEEFEFISGEYVTTGYHCNKCGCYYKKRSNYCPNCGAKMDGDGNG